jgi:hypothetical protein
MVEELLSTGREVRNEAPRRKQRGILMENDSLIRHKRRGIIPEKIKRMNQIFLSSGINFQTSSSSCRSYIRNS